MSNDKYRTLQELENVDQGEAKEGYSRLINRCLTLRRVPLDQFSIEDLRLMIGQQQGLSYLMPLAIDVLKDNILAEGDLYEGDLLQSVLNVDSSFWKDNHELMLDIQQILKEKKNN